MTLEEATSKYFDAIRQDHHKDRDCHFYINKVYSYGNPPVYQIEHFGYLNRLPENLAYKTFSTEKGAEACLADWLQSLLP